jgi:hypothetical protein
LIVYVPALIAAVNGKVALAAFPVTVPEVMVPIVVEPFLIVKVTVPALTVPLLGVTVADRVTEVAPYVALATLAAVVVVAAAAFPTAKSLNAVKPLPVAVVAVLIDPPGGGVQALAAYLRTSKAPDVVEVPASRSPATNVRAALYVVNTIPLGVTVQ